MGRHTATNTSDDDTIPPPVNVETLPNATEKVPPIVSRSMRHRNTVGAELIAWTTFDAQWKPSLGRASCRNTYWILTDQEVIITNDSWNGIGEKSIQHIPLRNITECGIHKACSDQFPTLRIQIIDAKRDENGRIADPIVGYGLAGYDSFLIAIFRQRDQVVSSRLPISVEEDAEVKYVGDEKRIPHLERAHETSEGNQGKVQEMVPIASNDQENGRPDNVGTLSNLPGDIRSMVYLGSSHLIAWSTWDPELESSLFRQNCCFRTVFGLCGLILFTATHDLFGSILLFSVYFFFFQIISSFSQQRRRNTYWILTDRDLILVTRSYGPEDRIQYISLNHIVHCGIVNGGFCRVTPASSLRVYIDTLFSGARQYRNYESACGLKGIEWFKGAILQQRDQYNSVTAHLPESSHNVV